MNSKIKTIIIIVIVAIVLVLIYIFFIKKAPEAMLTNSSGAPMTGSTTTSTDTNLETAQIGQDFVSLLLSVKSIKLDDSIFKNEAFISLKDSSILLVPTKNEGRPNPFAPIGSEVIIIPTLPPPPTTPPPTTPLPATP